MAFDSELQTKKKQVEDTHRMIKELKQKEGQIKVGLERRKKREEGERRRESQREQEEY